MVLSEKLRPKSAFVSSFGKWEFKRCPFGLAQAPAYFQRLVNEVLLGLTFAFGYLDDILVYSPDNETHLEHLKKLFIKLREANLKLKEVNCNFLKKTYPIFRTHSFGKRYNTNARKIGVYTRHASTQNSKGSKTISWTYRILSKICTKIF